jgi:hypothetical protein
MSGLNSSISREKKIGEIAEIIYAENRSKGLPADPMRDWNQAEQIFDDKAVYFGWWLPARFIRKYYYKIIALTLTAIVLLFAWNLKTGQDLKEISIRPYVSVDMIDPIQISDGEGKNVYFGNYIILNNTGKTPAANVSVRYFLTSEIEKAEPENQKWIDEKIEGVGSLGFIAPGAFIKEPGFRALSPSAKYYYFEAIVSYRGLASQKRYWTHVKKVFQFDRPAGKFKTALSDSEWDRNSSFGAPPMSTGKEIGEFVMQIAKK